MADPSASANETTAVSHAPAARPNQSVATGRSHMAEFGAQLAASYQIVRDENEPTYPYTICRLDPRNLFDMFFRMIMQLVLPISRELGYPDPAVLAQGNALRLIARCIAFQAVNACYVVCYNKARRYDPQLTGGLPAPALSFTTFPIYISALINSIGPIQRDDIPSRRLYIPMLHQTDVNLVLPANYSPRFLILYKEKVQRSKIMLSNVELLGATSSAWWTFWPVNGPITSIADPVKERPDDPDFLFEKSIYSPVKYEEVEQYLKVAVIYAPGPLTKPGIGPWSATNWYETDDLLHFPGDLPPPSAFPAATRAYPFYWNNAAVFLAIPEGQEFHIDAPPPPGNQVRPDLPPGFSRDRRGRLRFHNRYASPALLTQHANVQQAPQARNVRRRLEATGRYIVPNAPQHPAAAAQNNGETINQYRIVYHYFDHIAVNCAQPREYANWVYEMCQSI